MHTDIKVGLSCNNLCVHCIMSPVQARMRDSDEPLNDTTEVVFQKINRAADEGYDRITLTGGEVTIRHDFVALVRHALERDLSVTIQTNGRALSDIALVSALAELNRNRIDLVVAIHSHDSRTHDRITNSAGSHKQTRTAVELLRSSGFDVCGKMVLSKANYTQIDSTLGFMRELCIQEAIIAFPHAEDFETSRFSEVVPTYAAIKDPLAFALIRAVAGGVHAVCETIPFCVMGSSAFWPLSLDLSHLAQEQDRLGTQILMPGSSEPIDWRGSRKLIKSKMLACAICLLDGICEGPWCEYVDHYGVDEFRPVSDASQVEQFIEKLGLC